MSTLLQIPITVFVTSMKTREQTNKLLFCSCNATRVMLKATRAHSPECSTRESPFIVYCALSLSLVRGPAWLSGKVFDS